MGNAALDGITVYKDGSTYHYIVRFHDIKVGTLTDGITRFWVNGTEYPVTSTGGAMNQVQVHFTSGEQLIFLFLYSFQQWKALCQVLVKKMLSLA